MQHKTRLAAALAAMAWLTSSAASADVVTEWNLEAIDTGRRLALGPNPASRAVAIVHIAIHDAVVAVTHTAEPYRPGLVADPDTSLDAAVAAAAYTALIVLFPQQAGDLDRAYDHSLAAIPDGAPKDRGIVLGRASAGAILAVRATDKSGATETYAGSTALGLWRPTPLANATATPLAASVPHWRSVTPFALTSPSQFRAPAPPALTSTAYATAYNEVKDLGRIDSTTRTAEQTAIARFWVQQTHIPFNAAARAVSLVKHLTLVQNARLFALLNIALADTRISAWDTKYQYGFWRPITAIAGRDASTDAGADAATDAGASYDDGNPATEPDLAWLPLIETPNHPSYSSGHSITGAAGARVLARYFGSDAISFSLASDSLPGVVRGFSSFSAAAQENADSRVYGGIHFRFDNEAGLNAGKQVADEDDGCDCRAAGKAPSAPASALLSLAGLVLLRKRRRG